MKDTLLLLRSYGDLVVALGTYAAHPQPRQMELVASVHLKPLYDALCDASLLARVPAVHFEDFGIRHQILGCFTDRYLMRMSSLKELRSLGVYLKTNFATGDRIFMEQTARLPLAQFFTGVSLAGAVHNGKQNIYQAYQAFWGGASHANETTNPSMPTIQNVLLLPGSRKKIKVLPISLVQELVALEQTAAVQIRVAGLPTEIEQIPGNPLVYRDFSTLIDYMKAADFIISADSLPAHLAQLMCKPHWILYNSSINHAWLTPYAATHQCCGTFADSSKLMHFIGSKKTDIACSN